MSRNFDPLVGFTPPSDFVDESPSSGGGKTWLKVAGIGCGAFLLIFGLLFAVGAFKVVSCCGDLKDVGMNTAAASQYSMEFGQMVQQEQWADAHAMLTPEYQAQVDAAQFEAMFAPHQELIDTGVPLMDNFQPEQINDPNEITQIKTWNTQIRYFPSAGKDALVVTWTVRLTGQEGETPLFGIEQVTVSPREVDFRLEPPAKIVLEMHGHLQAGQMSRAFSTLHPEMRDGGQVKFKAFIEEQGTLLTRSTMEIEEVRYPEHGAAQVTARVVSSDGQKAIITYDARLFMNQQWSIAGISPLIETLPTPEAPEKEKIELDDAPEGGEKGEGEPAETGSK